MLELTKRRIYGATLAQKIEAMGSMAVAIANRWQMGWPDRVDALLKVQTYLDALETQLSKEMDVLVNEAGLRHLARHEILQMYEISEAPPAAAT